MICSLPGFSGTFFSFLVPKKHIGNKKLRRARKVLSTSNVKVFQPCWGWIFTSCCCGFTAANEYLLRIISNCLNDSSKGFVCLGEPREAMENATCVGICRYYVKVISTFSHSFYYFQLTANHQFPAISDLLRIPGSHFLEERFGRELLRLRSLRSGCDDVEVGWAGWVGVVDVRKMYIPGKFVW